MSLVLQGRFSTTRQNGFATSGWERGEGTATGKCQASGDMTQPKPSPASLWLLLTLELHLRDEGKRRWGRGVWLGLMGYQVSLVFMSRESTPHDRIKDLGIEMSCNRASFIDTGLFCFVTLCTHVTCLNRACHPHLCLSVHLKRKAAVKKQGSKAEAFIFLCLVMLATALHQQL